MKSRQLILLVATVVAVTVVVLINSLTASWQHDSKEAVVVAQSLDNSEAGFANCRYGVTSLNPKDTQGVAKVNAGWYLDFSPYPDLPAPSNNAEFSPIISVRQDIGPGGYLPTWTSDPVLNKDFADFLKLNPGLLLLVGNEIERIGQGQIHAEVYARAYHDIYKFIKAADPTAQVAISGLVEVTPMRMQYLNKVWKAYYKAYGVAIPVDVWNMHLYPLAEVKQTDEGLKPSNAGVALGTNINLGKRESNLTPQQCTDPFDDIYCIAEMDDMQIFEEQIRMMRQWMKDHGEQNKPLVLSEFSILWPYVLDAEGCFISDENEECFDPERVVKFLRLSFDHLNKTKSADLGYAADSNRLVQRWMWFATWNEPGFTGQSSNILTDDRQNLSEVGEAYHKWVIKEPLYHNLIAEDVATVTVPSPQVGTAGAHISATFRNNGNNTIQQPFDVSFYSNSSLTAKIGTVRIDPGVSGCATMPYTASLEWKGLGEGRHDYWVVVDSQNEVAEVPANNADNTGRGMVLVYDQKVQLPMVFKK